MKASTFWPKRTRCVMTPGLEGSVAMVAPLAACAPQRSGWAPQVYTERHTPASVVHLLGVQGQQGLQYSALHPAGGLLPTSSPGVQGRSPCRGGGGVPQYYPLISPRMKSRGCTLHSSLP